ncbi:YjjG family noncanonical pyrimidine nucleotidase [Pseudorhodoferax sp.]|uniref:YjjG family noncanonical pyrimidine nucleotidase n=1 Tax=Pseudorhodoferax sp. TaxID=1993553 RepID=UPI002DD6AC85|nr:YjjG family noncanonical pyrimidine nucleotidase [Pseudorhodoferax sp.]
MKHKLFLFDLDDTLLDYQASEKFAFAQAMQAVGHADDLATRFEHYRAVNFALWQQFEAGAISLDFLRTERFRQSFLTWQLELDHARASRLYLDAFASTAVLVEGARELCEQLGRFGVVGVMTNGVEAVQNSRLAASGLRPHLAFVATSQACGFAKPDSRFFEHTARIAGPFSKAETVMVGDRLEADILGANRHGIESCWFNPGRLAHGGVAAPTYEVASLHDIVHVLERAR